MAARVSAASVAGWLESLHQTFDRPEERDQPWGSVPRHLRACLECVAQAPVSVGKFPPVEGFLERDTLS